MSSLAAPGLLERQAELEAIDESADAAAGGGGCTVLIEGQPGIGKSALLAAAQARGTEVGMTVLSARAGDTELDYPWGVVRQLFEAELAGRSADERAALLADAAALAGPALGIAGTRAPDASEFGALHGLYWLAVNLAQRGPLMLTIDDLHWCDLESLRFVAYLAARLHELPVLFIAATRPVRASSAGRRQLVTKLALEPATRRLHPAPLSLAATSRLVTERLSANPAPAFCEACMEATGGNPFLLGELLAEVEAERVDPVPSAVERLRRMTPEAISRSVLLRIAGLAQPSLALARAVAVLGAGATATRAARVAEIELDVAIGALQALIDADILSAGEAIGFSHPIVRASVYEDFPGLERSRWHERAARVLEAEGAGAQELTPHLLAAVPSGSTWTVSRLREAAADARGRGAPDAAIGCLRRALAEPPARRERVAVLRDLGASEALRDPEASSGHLAQALAASADARERGEIAVALGGVQAFAGQFGAAADTIEAALQGVDERTVELRSSLEVELLNAAHWDLITRPRTHTLRADLERRSSNGERLDPRLHAYLAIATAERGENRSLALLHARRALESVPATAASSTAIRHVITALAVCDELREAETRAHSWLADAQQRGHVLVSALASSVSALLMLLAGRISDSLAYARQSLAPSAELWTPPFGVAWLIEALTERGQLTEAEQELSERGLDGELPRTWPFALLRFCRGRARAARGQHERALDDLLTAGELSEALGIVNPALLPWRSSAAESLLALDRAPQGRELAAQELLLARRWGSQRALGIALRAAGLLDPGPGTIELLRAAARVLEDSPAPLEHARALTDLGAALRRAGRRTEARELLRRGLDLAHRLGGHSLAARARGELRVAGARPRRDALRGRDALTPSELRVARMAAEGRTNRQIAQALFVTLRTVELHLTSSYGKLGIVHREQLSDALDERRPEPAP